MTKTIRVEGMTCGHCRMIVEKAAKSVKNVSKAEVDLGKGELTAAFKDGKDTIEDVKKLWKRSDIPRYKSIP